MKDITKVNLAIVDDNQSLRQALKVLFQTEPDLEVIISAQDGIDLLEKIGGKIPDIIVMDIRMPKMDGIKATKEIVTKYPSIKIIAHSVYDNEENIIEMYKQGVKSFISKSGDPLKLLQAIRVVLGGGNYVTDETLSIFKKFLMLGSFISDTKVEDFMAKPMVEAISKCTVQGKDISISLSENERILIRLLALGKSSTEIGEILFKSHRTIEKQREKLYIKFNVENKEQLISEAVRQHII